MAEGGIVERIFGGAEGQEAEGDALANGADPMAASVAMDAARFDPELSREAAVYLRKQAHLVDLQAEHLHEQRAVQLDHLKLRRVGERMRVAIQGFFVAVGALIGLGFLLMVWGAATDHGLVVEAFSVPPDLAGRGLTGQVVAKQVLDRLAELQAQSTTLRAADTYSNNWGEDLKVEIPETGVSVADVRRWLRETLGHETRITGEVYRGPAGLTITARAGEEAAKSFTGTDAELDKLIAQAAEEVFHRTQPYRYAVYLQNHGRRPEAEATFRAMFASTDAHERAWAHIGLGRALSLDGDDQAYAAQCRLALAEIPHFAPALNYLSFAEWYLEHETAAVEAGQAFFAAKGSVGRDIAAVDRQGLVLTQRSLDAVFLGDEGRAAEAGAALAQSPSSIAFEGWNWLASALRARHDLVGARAALGHMPVSSDRLAALMTVLVSGGDSSALALARQANTIGEGQYGRGYAGRNDAPWLALALAQAGDLKGAQATITSTPPDCDLCLRVRGTVAAYAGDQAGAEQWFAQAVARTPQLPWAYLARGQARFRAGDLDGALADARATVRVAPRFADGYGLWGDVLARRGRWSEARGRYDQALRFAPAWAAAHGARDEVARRA